MKRLFVQKSPTVDPEAPTTTNFLPSIFTSPSKDSTQEGSESTIEIVSQELMSAPIETRLTPIDTGTIPPRESQNSTMDDETYQYLYERWIGFSNDERAMEEGNFTTNGFLPELQKRRKEHDLKLTQQPPNLVPPLPLQHHITVWEAAPQHVKV